MPRPRREINEINPQTMTGPEMAAKAEQDVRRMLSSLVKSGYLREQEYEDVFQDLMLLFVSTEIRELLDVEKLQRGAKIGNYIFTVAKSYSVDYMRGDHHTVQDSEEGFLDLFTSKYTRSETETQYRAKYAKKLMTIVVAWLRKNGHHRKADFVDYLSHGLPKEEVQKKLQLVDSRGELSSRAWVWFVKSLKKLINEEFRLGRYTIFELLADIELIPLESLDLRMSYCRDSELMTFELEKELRRVIPVVKVQSPASFYRLILDGIADGHVRARREGGWLFIEKLSGRKFVDRVKKLIEIGNSQKQLDSLDELLRKLKGDSCE